MQVVVDHTPEEAQLLLLVRRNVWAARGPVCRSVAARGDNVSTMPRHELRKDARKPRGSFGTRLCPTGPWAERWALPRERADSEPGGQFGHLAAEAGGVRAGQPGGDRGHRPLDGAVAGAPGALDVRADHRDFGRLAATGERAEDVVDEGGAELGIEVGESEPGAQVDAVHPDLFRAHPRDVGDRDRAALHRPHLRRPGLGRQRLDRLGQSAAGRGVVGAEVGRRLRGGGRDALVAGLARGVHRCLDAGTGPGEQVDQRVGVAGEVGDDVRARPVGQRRGPGQVVVGKVLDEPGDGSLAVGPPAQRRLLPLPGLHGADSRRRGPPSGAHGPGGDSLGEGLPPAAGAGHLAVGQRTLRIGDVEVLGRRDDVGAELLQQLLLGPRGVVHLRQQRMRVAAGVEGGRGHTAVDEPDLLQPLVQAGAGVRDLGAVLLDRALAGGRSRHAEHVGRPTHDEQPHVGAEGGRSVARRGRGAAAPPPAATTWVGREPVSPSAIARAIARALPNMDSYTTRARTMPPHHLGRWVPDTGDAMDTAARATTAGVPCELGPRSAPAASQSIDTAPASCLPGCAPTDTEAAMNKSISRLRDAMNAHDAEAMARLFTPDYRSEQPLHPQRGFAGRDQVAANWAQMFEGIPNLEAGVVKETTAGGTSWSEWVWHGAHRDGSPFLMRGVIIAGLSEDGLVSWMRLYMESVEQGGAAIDDAVRQLSGATG